MRRWSTRVSSRWANAQKKSSRQKAQKAQNVFLKEVSFKTNAALPVLSFVLFVPFCGYLLCGLLPRMPAFGKFLDHLLIERGYIGRLPTGY